MHRFVVDRRRRLVFKRQLGIGSFFVLWRRRRQCWLALAPYLVSVVPQAAAALRAVPAADDGRAALGLVVVFVFVLCTLVLCARLRAASSSRVRQGAVVG